MHQPRPLAEIQNQAGLFWIYLRGEWRMADIVRRLGMPSAVSLAHGLVIDSWQICRDLPAIPIDA